MDRRPDPLAQRLTRMRVLARKSRPTGPNPPHRQGRLYRQAASLTTGKIGRSAEALRVRQHPKSFPPQTKQAYNPAQVTAPAKEPARQKKATAPSISNALGPQPGDAGWRSISYPGGISNVWNRRLYWAAQRNAHHSSWSQTIRISRL